jgi:hypothetical protein
MIDMHPDIQDLGVDHPYISMCLTAESGWGKTRFAGTHPSMLFLSTDPEGVEAAYFAGSHAKVWSIRTYEKLEEAIRWLRNGGTELFEWVGLDTATEIQKIMQAKWLEDNKEGRKGRHPLVLGIDGYQVTQLQFLDFVKTVNDLPIHKIWTAPPMALEDSDAEIYYIPNIHGIKGDLSQMFRGYMKIQAFGITVEKRIRRKGGEVYTKKTHRMLFETQGPYRAKERYEGALGAFMDDCTLPDIQAKLAAAHPKAISVGGTRRTRKPAARKRAARAS